MMTPDMPVAADILPQSHLRDSCHRYPIWIDSKGCFRSFSDYLCSPEENVHMIDFTRFKIRDMETGTVLFEITKPPTPGQPRTALTTIFCFYYIHYITLHRWWWCTSCWAGFTLPIVDAGDVILRLNVSFSIAFLYLTDPQQGVRSSVTPTPADSSGTSSPRLSCSCGRSEPRKSVWIIPKCRERWE